MLAPNAAKHIDALDRSGEGQSHTALSIACSFGLSDTASYLIESKANVNQGLCPGSGVTALHECLHHTHICKLLVKAGACHHQILSPDLQTVSLLEVARSLLPQLCPGDKPRVQRALTWVRSLPPRSVTGNRCERCGLDATTEGLQRLHEALKRPADQEGNAERCSNPDCDQRYVVTGLLRASVPGEASKPVYVNPRLKKCGRCKRAAYCSPACQRAHWSKHKPECKAPTSVDED